MNRPNGPKSNRGSHYKSLKPFFWAGLGWGLLGTLGIGLGHAGDARPAAMAWWAAFYLFSIADLALLAGLVGSLVAGPPAGSRGRWMARLLFLGFSKLGVLGGGVILMMGNRGIPNASLLSGLATLIVVPVLGGGLWSFTDPEADSSS